MELQEKTQEFDERERERERDTKKIFHEVQLLGKISP